MAFRFDPSAGLPSSSEDEQEDTGLRATNSRGDKGLASSSHVREQSGQSVKAAPSASKGDQLKVNGNLTATGKAKKSNFEKYLEDDASQFKDEDVSTSGIKEEKQGLRQQIISPLDEDPPPQGSLQWTRQEELGVMDLYQLDDLNPQEWSEFAISTLVLESKDNPSETDLEADNNNLAPSEKRIHFEMDNPAHASLFHIAEELQDEDDPLDIIMKDSTR